MQVVLVMFRADDERRSFSIARDITVIGRREDCDLRIPLGDVSRKHCRLVKDSQGVRVEDLGSSNGTFHNGHKIQEATLLSPGDHIQIGPIAFVVQIDGAPADDELMPPPPLADTGTSIAPGLIGESSIPHMDGAINDESSLEPIEEPPADLDSSEIAEVPLEPDDAEQPHG